MWLRRGALVALLTALLACLVALPAQQAAGRLDEPASALTRLLRYADISKDRVVFAYAGDLWIVSRQGGSARRLTSHGGEERFPKFSPDGKWIAFTSGYDGNPDVYVIPAEGGEPKRLTFHPGNDIVLGWTPDGKDILFRSDRTGGPPQRTTKLYLVSPQGGPARELPPPRADLTSFSPDGNKIAYIETSQEFRTWKRYHGGWSLPIAIYDLKKNTYEELPKSGGMDLFPMWHGNAIYFISDRDGVMNLYSYDLGSKQPKKLTDYKEYDIKWPSLGPDAIVFENGGLLYEYSIDSGETHNVPIEVHAEDVQARPEFMTVAENVSNFTISPAGVRALVEARGNLFTVPAEHGNVRTLTKDNSGVHEMNPTWSPDGKWIAYLSDKTGEYEVYVRPQLGGEDLRITSDGNMYRYGPTWSPDSKKLLYWDKLHRLWYVSVEEKKPVQVDQGDYGDISDGAWAPDSQWIAYSKSDRRGAGRLFLYSLEKRKAAQISNGYYNDGNPSFDPDGKYIFFTSQRFFFPSISRIDQRFNYYATDGLFAVTLKADTASPFQPQSDEEKVTDKDKKESAEKDQKGDAKKAEGDKKEEKKEEAPKPVQVDLEGIADRIIAVPVAPGIYASLIVRKGKFFYLAQPQESLTAGTDQDGAPKGVLHVYDLEKREDKVVIAGIEGYDADHEGKKVIYKAGPILGVIDAAPDKKIGDGKLDLSGMQVLIDPRQEWRQTFREAWRIERDFYWDPQMTGHDWKKIGERYEALLPWVANRSDLNYLIGEMIAELSTSHTYVGGGASPQKANVSVGMLGADLRPDGGYYRIARIYPGENWREATRSPLTEPGLKVKAGDYLIAANGRETKSSQDVYAYFQNLAGKQVVLKINNKPSADGAWEITVKPTAAEDGPRELAWVAANRKKVSDETGGRVGYMWVPDTGISGIIEFDKAFNAQLDKDGLIIDERYNGGGNIPDFFTEKLRRQRLAFLAQRDTKDVPWPPQGIFGPKIMLVNELAGSGGDAFPWFFRREKIGPIVGTRTWGGLVGIGNVQPLRDGGFVTAPGFGFWSADNGGEWIVEQHGVDPDYVVPQRPDLVVSGHDPQLEKAIELANDGLKGYDGAPTRPKYPVAKE
jgi:tricorn protease